MRRTGSLLNCHGRRCGRHRRQAAEWFGLFVASWDSLGLGEILQQEKETWLPPLASEHVSFASTAPVGQGSASETLKEHRCKKIKNPAQPSGGGSAVRKGHQTHGAEQVGSLADARSTHRHSLPQGAWDPFLVLGPGPCARRVTHTGTLTLTLGCKDSGCSKALGFRLQGHKRRLASPLYPLPLPPN